MRIVARHIGNFLTYENGRWHGQDERIIEMLNQALLDHPMPEDHTRPTEYVLELARKTYPYFKWFEVFYERDPRDQAPNVWQCVFNPDVTIIPVENLLIPLKMDDSEK